MGSLLNREFTTAAERLRVVRLQRSLARATKHSRNRRKLSAELAAIRARERRRRKDFCAQTAHQLAESNAMVALEALSDQTYDPNSERNSHSRPVAM